MTNRKIKIIKISKQPDMFYIMLAENIILRQIPKLSNYKSQKDYLIIDICILISKRYCLLMIKIKLRQIALA